MVLISLLVVSALLKKQRQRRNGGPFQAFGLSEKEIQRRREKFQIRL